MPDDRAQEEIRLWERLEGDRTTFKSHWQDIANNLQPERSDYTTRRSPGQKLMSYIYDGVPMWALESFAAGIHALLTSPTLRWFSLRLDDDRISNKPVVAAWLEAASNAMYQRFNGPRHNFASQSYQLYEDIGAIGQASMAILDSAKSGTLFSCRHMRECCIMQDDEDRTTTLIRSWEYDAGQAWDAWGKAAGEGVMKALEKGDVTKKFQFIHSVRPRRNRDPDRGRERAHMPFLSRYINVTDKTTIDEGGFLEFPYVAPRLRVKTGERYGRGIGTTALPDIKMLYAMKQTLIKSAQKIVDPPLMVPDAGFLLPIKTVPGSLNYYQAGTKDEIKPIETNANLPIGLEMVRDLQTQLIRTFYVEWMLMPSSPDDPAAAGKGVTATYVLQQRDEKMRLLSPMLARMQSEFLGPLIDRTFAIMWRQSVRARFGQGAPFPPPPPEIAGIPYRVEYVSPIAIAQKSSQLDTLQRLVQTQLALLQADPTTPKVLDGEGIMRMTARDLNAPALALKTPAQVAAQQQAEAQAQAEMNGHAQIANLAGAMRDGGAGIASLAKAAPGGGLAA